MKDSFEDFSSGSIEEIKRPEDYGDNFNRSIRHRLPGVNPLNSSLRNPGLWRDLSEDVNRNMWICPTRSNRSQLIPTGINMAAPIASYRSFIVLPGSRTRRPGCIMLCHEMLNPNPSLSERSPSANSYNRKSDWLTDDEQDEIIYQSSSNRDRRPSARSPLSANRISEILFKHQPHRRSSIGEQQRRVIRR